MALDPIETWRLNRPIPGEEYAEGHEPIPAQFPPGLGPATVAKHRQFTPFDLSGLAAGASVTLRVEYEPEAWLVALGPTTNTAVALYLSSAALGQIPAARLSPNGMATIPGRGIYLTVWNTGTAPLGADCTCLALAGFDVPIQLFPSG